MARSRPAAVELRLIGDTASALADPESDYDRPEMDLAPALVAPVQSTPAVHERGGSGHAAAAPSVAQAPAAAPAHPPRRQAPVDDIHENIDPDNYYFTRYAASLSEVTRKESFVVPARWCDIPDRLQKERARATRSEMFVSLSVECVILFIVAIGLGSLYSISLYNTLSNGVLGALTACVGFVGSLRQSSRWITAFFIMILVWEAFFLTAAFVFVLFDNRQESVQGSLWFYASLRCETTYYVNNFGTNCTVPVNATQLAAAALSLPADRGLLAFPGDPQFPAEGGVGVGALHVPTGAECMLACIRHVVNDLKNTNYVIGLFAFIPALLLTRHAREACVFARELEAERQKRAEAEAAAAEAAASAVFARAREESRAMLMGPRPSELGGGLFPIRESRSGALSPSRSLDGDLSDGPSVAGASVVGMGGAGDEDEESAGAFEAGHDGDAADGDATEGDDDDTDEDDDDSSGDSASDDGEYPPLAGEDTGADFYVLPRGAPVPDLPPPNALDVLEGTDAPRSPPLGRPGLSPPDSDDDERILPSSADSERAARIAILRGRGAGD